MPELIMNGIMGFMLLVTAVQDLLKKKVEVWIMAVGAILLCICIPFNNGLSIPDRIGGIFVGICVIVISKVTGGKIGLGDGIILSVTGIGLGLWGNLELFAIALFAAAIVSIILLVFRLADRKKSIPFVPFLFLGYLIFLLQA